MKKKLLSLAITFFSFFLLFGFNLAFAQTSSATDTADDFEILLENTYTVNMQGVTTVNHKVKIKNLSPTLYMQQYSLYTEIAGIDKDKIKVKSNNKDLDFEFTDQDKLKTIAVTFPDKMVGQNKTREINFSYVSDQIADVQGNVLELDIAHIGQQNEFNSTVTKIITPAFFSTPNQISPSPDSSEFKSEGVLTTFTANNIEKITALFGMNQFYKVTVQETLENKSSVEATMQIGLPTNTTHQTVTYQSLEPYPQQLKLDNQGNLLATYNLAPNQALTLQNTFIIKKSLEPINSDSLNTEYFGYEVSRGQINPVQTNEGSLNFIAFGTKRSDNKRDLQIDVLANFVEPKVEVKVELIQIPLISIMGKNFYLDGLYKLKTKNTTGQIITDAKIVINDKTETTKTLLPFETKETVITFTKGQYLQGGPVIIKVLDQKDNQLFSEEFYIMYGEDYIKHYKYKEIYVYVGITAIILAIITWSVLVFRQTKKRPVRR